MNKIFITGGTGFLGNQLIHDLAKDGHRLVLLCRNKSGRRVTEKIRFWSQSPYSHLIEWIEGDLNKPFLGISADQLKRLKGQICSVYHLAALVKFEESLEDELIATNLIGTQNVLDFSAAVGVSDFNYVSTAYTVGKSDFGVEALYDLNRPFLNPYEKSKCYAEHKVMAMKDSFSNVAIFRPAIIVGDSQTGEALSPFTLYGFIRGLEVFKKRLIRMKEWGKEMIFLEGDPEGTSNFVPVDYVSTVMTAVQKSTIKNGIFHITNPKPPKNGLIFSLIKEIMDIKYISLMKKYNTSEGSKWDEFLHGMLDVYKVYLNRNIRFEDGQTVRLLASIGQSPLHMSEEMLRRIISGYREPMIVKA